MNFHNQNFDNFDNFAINQLINRSGDKRQPRVNKKNCNSKLDDYFQFIHERKIKGKSLAQISAALKNEKNIEVSKSALCRYISKKIEF